MATKIIKAQITQRRDTLANWASVNPVLLPGELGFVTDDVNRYKIGDGVHAWNDLPFRGFDGALAQGLGDSTTAAISQKAVTDELKKKVDTEKMATINGQRIDEGGNIEIKGEEFDKEGNYPLLHVGTADDLAGRGESVPAEFGFRASGGKSIKDGRAYLKRIKGNSVVWNQRFKAYKPNVGTQVINGVTFALAEDGSVTAEGTAEDSSAVFVVAASPLTANHKYLIIAPSINSQWGTSALYYNGYTSAGNSSEVNNGWAIFTAINTHTANLVLTCWTGMEISASTKVRIHDLTKMFQAGNEPTTIEDFNARVATLGVDMYAYNEGEVIHCNTESIKSVGDNAWDEQWEEGNYHPSSGGAVPNPTRIRSKNAIRIIGSESYYLAMPKITSAFISLFFYDAEDKYISSQDVYMTVNKPIINPPQGAEYMRLSLSAEYGTTYKHDILISLYHSGWKAQKDDQYQPYWEDILPLPIIRKYFPQGMKSAGSAHDEIRYNKASGKWEKVQMIGSVDLGTLEWKTQTIKDVNYFQSDKNTLNAVIADDRINNERYILCAKYQALNRSEGNTQYNSKEDKVILLNHGYYGNVSNYKDLITIRDTSYTDAATFKAAMQGVILYYELAGPIVTELDAEDQNFRDYYNVADFGTEQSQSSVPSANFSADIIYQFNAVDMIREHELEITELQKVMATMQAQLTSLINGGQ